jgi:hypothetical protein
MLVTLDAATTTQVYYLASSVAGSFLVAEKISSE